MRKNLIIFAILIIIIGLLPFICFHCGTQNPEDPSQRLSLKREREEEILLDHNHISFNNSSKMTSDLAAKDVQILELQEKLLQCENKLYRTNDQNVQILESQEKLLQSEINLNRTNVQLAIMIKESSKKPKKIKKSFMLRIADAINCKSVEKDSTKSPEVRDKK
jgi:hypothetical protein